MESNPQGHQDKLNGIRNLLTRWYGRYIEANENGTVEQFEGELLAIIGETKGMLKVPPGTRVRYRDADRDPVDASMDRTGVITKWGTKWVTIKDEKTGKTAWSRLTGCQQISTDPNTQIKPTTAQTQAEPQQTPKQIEAVTPKTKGPATSRKVGKRNGKVA